MITDAYDHGKQASIFHLPISATSKLRPMRIHEAYEIRSKRNIGAWREFLPEDCVAAMTRMGWDRTT
jgi:hypothetical protein